MQNMGHGAGQRAGLGDKLRLLVCGGRHFDDLTMVEEWLERIHALRPVSVLIHGGLPGLGLALENWARRNDVRLIRYPSNFSLGKRGDFERDDFMLEDGRPDALLAFPGGVRTARLLDRAKGLGLDTLQFGSARSHGLVPA